MKKSSITNFGYGAKWRNGYMVFNVSQMIEIRRRLFNRVFALITLSVFTTPVSRSAAPIAVYPALEGKWPSALTRWFGRPAAARDVFQPFYQSYDQ